MNTEQALRDLKWVVNSPSLLVDPPGAEPQVMELPGNHVEVDGDRLIEFLESRQSHRVGRYFEALVHFWLDAVCGYEIVAAGQQVRNGKQTIGELDFVYRDDSRRLVHLEIAVKFYLHQPFRSVQGSHLIGPNSADTFERKTSKLFEKQLPLSRQVYKDITHRLALVKGRIFYHPEWPALKEPPTRLSPSHLEGEWLAEAELDLLAPEEDSNRFRVLKKPLWLSSVGWPDSELDLEFEELKEALIRQFEVRPRPVLVSEFQSELGGVREVRRVFVVPDTWPD